MFVVKVGVIKTGLMVGNEVEGGGGAFSCLSCVSVGVSAGVGCGCVGVVVGGDVGLLSPRRIEWRDFMASSLSGGVCWVPVRADVRQFVASMILSVAVMVGIGMV